MKEFRIEKEGKLEWTLLRARIIFFEDLSKQEVETRKVTVKNKEEIKEFSKNLKKIIKLDKKEIKYETNKLLCDLSMKKTKIDEIKMVEKELKISKNVLIQLKILFYRGIFCEYYC